MYVWVNTLAPWGAWHLRDSDGKTSKKKPNAKTALIFWISTVCQQRVVAPLHAAASEETASILPLEMEAKHLGVLTVV